MGTEDQKLLTDVLNYLVPNQVNQLSTHLQTTSGLPIATLLQGNQIWNLKGLKGFPWDMNTFDSGNVFMSITEVNYTEPKPFKMFASKSRPTMGNGGVVLAPRFIDNWNPPIITYDSTYRTYADDGSFTTSNLGGPIETHVSPPFQKDFSGTIGLQNCIAITYKWGAGYSNMEVNYYVQGLGWVQWELWTLQNGCYKISSTSAFNTEVAGIPPVVNFPQAVPVI